VETCRSAVGCGADQALKRDISEKD